MCCVWCCIWMKRHVYFFVYFFVFFFHKSIIVYISFQFFSRLLHCNYVIRSLSWTSSCAIFCHVMSEKTEKKFFEQIFFDQTKKFFRWRRSNRTVLNALLTQMSKHWVEVPIANTGKCSAQLTSEPYRTFAHSFFFLFFTQVWLWFMRHGMATGSTSSHWQHRRHKWSYYL